MAWCALVPWANPVIQLPFNMSAFGNGYAGAGDFGFNFSPLTLTEIDNFMTNAENNAYTWTHVDGPDGLCLCVTANADGQLPASIKHDFEGGGVIDFSEREKTEVPPVDPEIQACLDCFEALFGCSFLDMIPADMPLTKAAIVAAIQAGLTPGEGEPEPATVSATIIGSVLGLPGAFVPGTSVIPEELSPAVNPSCEGDDFGWLVVDLNLPETTALPTTAATTYTVIDASAGMGTVYVLDKSTNTVLGQSYPPGAGGQGNNVPVPFDHTISYTIPVGADPTEVCLVFNAFGQAGAWEGSCDQIGPGETIVTTTPDPCAAAVACFAEIFGCDIEDMIDFPQPPEIPEFPPVPVASNAIPVPDNEVDAAIRTGIAGTSADFARADHNHPIRRQANPGDPVLVPNANLEITSGPLVLDRWSDEESYAYHFRTRITQEAALNNWGWLTVPNIAGFQRPRIDGVGTYRQGSTAVQIDDGGANSNTGAGPRGPYMGKEAHEWSSTQRIYMGYYRRDNAHVTWVEFNATYTRV